MSGSIAVAPLVLGLIAIACVVAGIYLIATSRRTVGSGPRCGHCQYNLTGSTANRCPECGRLFIEVGVVMQAARTSQVRRWVGIGLLATIPLFCLGTGSLLRLRSAGSARQARAVAVNAAAAQRAAQNQSTTAPASQPGP